MARHSDSLLGASVVAYIFANGFLILSLTDVEWITYEGGYSSLWDHCNSTLVNRTNKKGKQLKETACEEIPSADVTEELALLRKLLAIGLCIILMSLWLRYYTWPGRGRWTDVYPAITALASGVMVSVSLSLPHKFHDSLYLEAPERFPNATLGHSIAFVYISAVSSFVSVITTAVTNRVCARTADPSYSCVQAMLACCLISMIWSIVSEPVRQCHLAYKRSHPGRDAADNNSRHGRRVNVPTLLPSETQRNDDALPTVTSQFGSHSHSVSIQHDEYSDPPPYEDLDPPPYNMSVSNDFTETDTPAMPPPSYEEAFKYTCRGDS